MWPRKSPLALLAGLIWIWAARLGLFWYRRVHADGGDQRFDRLKQSAPRFLVAWTMQGVWIVVTGLAAALAISQAADSPPGWLDAVGLTLWMIGFGVAVVADAQKRAHRRVAPGAFASAGLWARSRHPNYFGEIVLWCGIALIAASGLPERPWLALISPLFVIVLLTRVSGVPLLERSAEQRWGHDPNYHAYVARTPVLVPRLTLPASGLVVFICLQTSGATQATVCRATPRSSSTIPKMGA
ncbi:MAG: steroid 5-alpha reductase family enzyme [Myxococcota bacterium]